MRSLGSWGVLGAIALAAGACVAATPSASPSTTVAPSLPPAVPSLTPAPSASATVSWGPLAIIPPQDGTDLARAQGTLRITDACAYLDQGGEEMFLFWPADRVSWDEAARAITFTNYDGTIATVRDGDPVVLGGGADSEAESGVSGAEWAATMTWVVPPASTCSLDSRFGVGVVDAPAPGPTATSSPSAEPIATPLPTIPPFPRTPTLDGHASSLEAGCRAVYYLSEMSTSDQCGPVGFDEVLRAKPIAFSPGEQVTIAAPPHYVFSAIDANLPDGWSVRIAPASDLEGLEVGSTGMPKKVGRLLASGIGPDRKVRITLPTESGSYVIQLAAPLVRDSWTFAPSLAYWLVRVP